MTKDFEILQTCYVQCEMDTSQVRSGAERTLNVIREVGGSPLEVLDGPKVVYHANPLGTLNEKGSLLGGVDFQHSLLARSNHYPKCYDRFQPVGKFSFVREGAFVGIEQFGDGSHPEKLDSLAHGQLSLARLLYPCLRPAFAYIDEMGMNSPGGRKTRNPDVKYIFWATFFSPPYVERYGGRDFLLGAPVWKKEVLDDGSILLVVTESYFSWWSKPPKDIAAYWQARFPDMKPFRAKW